MLFIEIGLTLTVSMLGVLVAHAMWPCLVHLDWTPFILAFVVILSLCMFLHMLRWKCWSYLCHNRQRLRSMSEEHKRPMRFVRIVWAVLTLWSVAYALVSALLDCGTPWWPGLFVPAWSVFYTLSMCSASYVSWSSASDSSEPSSVNTPGDGSAGSRDGSGGSTLYSGSSNGISSSDDS